MLRKFFFTIAFVGWMVFVTFSSLYSFQRLNAPSGLIPHADKIVHFTFYFVACILGMFFLREITEGAIKFQKALLIMIFSTIAFGAIIEVLQHAFTLKRSGDILDALANSFGAITAAGVVKLLFSKERNLKWKV